MNVYQSFRELKASEHDYFIEVINRLSPITIIAPHGGNIEPHTSEIARMIAGNQYNLFSFNGTRQSDNRKLHITSHRYDEENALLLTRSSSLVITIHGCTERKPKIFVGGLHEGIKLELIAALQQAGFHAERCGNNSSIGGSNPKNICNRTILAKGVQLEFSRGIRDCSPAWIPLSVALRQVLHRFVHVFSGS